MFIIVFTSLLVLIPLQDNGMSFLQALFTWGAIWFALAALYLAAVVLLGLVTP